MIARRSRDVADLNARARSLLDAERHSGAAELRSSGRPLRLATT